MTAIHRIPSAAPPTRLSLQPAAVDVWDNKYRLRRADGSAVDAEVGDSYARVARALAATEASPALREHWNERFLWAFEHGAIPAGRILSNVGAEEHRHAASTVNCTVSGTIVDTLPDILAKLQEAGLTLKGGSGIGYEFSTLRPRGAYVSGSGACTSGPLSFMDVYDRMCLTIASAGGRRGAQMAVFDIAHPDVMEFIRAKREDGRLRQFNLSLLVTDAFMQAVAEDGPWMLSFPLTAQEASACGIDLEDSGSVVWRPWVDSTNYIRNAQGEVACRIYQTVRARDLWDLVMRSTYEYAEPGFILVDRLNDLNNNWFCENLRATNPCGEQPLPPYGACLLGSINLTAFVQNPFTESSRFDWATFREVVTIFTRMLDNVVELNGLALPQQRAEIQRKRRHGMGFLGLGSAMTMLRMRYGEAASLAFTERVCRDLAIAGWQAALELAREKGPAPLMAESFVITPAMLQYRPELAADGYSVGDEIRGSVLHARYSRYMQQLAGIEPELVASIEREGARFTHHSSIAPTGTIALSLANNASNGIEPSFAHVYIRNLLREGRKTRDTVEVLSYELLAYRHSINAQASPDADRAEHRLPDYFLTADEITPAQHIAVQAAAQTWIDSSISKTANVPTDMPFEAFKDIYIEAYRAGLKGFTTFRFNPARFQGVLVKNTDLVNTRYEFTLEDGETVCLRGDEAVEYEDEVHTAANLFDALKEGYYQHGARGTQP